MLPFEKKTSLSLMFLHRWYSWVDKTGPPVLLPLFPKNSRRYGGKPKMAEPKSVSSYTGEQQ